MARKKIRESWDGGSIEVSPRRLNGTDLVRVEATERGADSAVLCLTRAETRYLIAALTAAIAELGDDQ